MSGTEKKIRKTCLPPFQYGVLKFKIGNLTFMGSNLLHHALGNQLTNTTDFHKCKVNVIFQWTGRSK